MHCSSCRFDNREGAKFCNECGAPLALRCSSCGTENRAGAKFCNECGTALTSKEKVKKEVVSSQLSVVSPQPLAPSTQSLAERRQLTVMFCDLVDSTALSAQLDPEELREVIQAYQETATAVVRRYEGYIAQHLGDGLLVYFGYPTAHEDDAARAVWAGLEIITAIRKRVPSPVQGALPHKSGFHTIYRAWIPVPNNR